MVYTPPIYRAVDEIQRLATEWATQPTDYDEDTEQQIADGKEILEIFERYNLPAPRPTVPTR